MFLIGGGIRAFMALLLIVLFMAAAVAGDPNPPTIHSASGAWPIRRQWTPAETGHYARWVENIYLLKTRGGVEQRGAKLERLLTDPEMNLLQDPAFLGEGANPQLPAGVIRAMHGLMDCGKFTAFMPAYYAYRRALPWMSAYVVSGQGDIRTSPFNIPSGSANSFTTGSPGAFFMNAVGSFISGNYRVPLNGKNAHLSDTVPVAINRKYLLPGCINYVDGHCLLLARVSEYGELHFLNCSTTHTRDIFSYNGMNTVSGITPRGNSPANEWDGCFQGLRVPRYPIAVTDASGRVTQVRRRTDGEMAEFGFSTEQYDIVREIIQNQFIAEGRIKAQSVHDLIRLRMKSVDSIAPFKFMEEYVGDLFEAYAFRVGFVRDAWSDVRAHGPIVYPEERPNENIFQALGRWETWSSPSSDVDRRNKYFYLADWLEYAVRLFGIVPEFVDLTGLEKYAIRSQADLARALVAEKNRIFAGKSLEYTNSAGGEVRLTLLDIEERLYDLSFDPNHPPELRWGAPMGSAERSSAPERHTPLPGGKRVAMEDAYRWQAYYRSLGARETDVSCLQGMFTSGYPVRDKLDAQLGKWDYAKDAVLAEKAPPDNPAPRAQPAVMDTVPAMFTPDARKAPVAQVSAKEKEAVARRARDQYLRFQPRQRLVVRETRTPRNGRR